MTPRRRRHTRAGRTLVGALLTLSAIGGMTPAGAGVLDWFGLGGGKKEPPQIQEPPKPVELFPPDADISFVQSTASIAENAGKVELRVRRATSLSDTVSVRWRSESGTAKAGLNFEVSTGELVFAPNETEKTIAIGVVDDRTYTGDQTFRVVLTPVRNAVVKSGGEMTVTIQESSPRPQMAKPPLLVAPRQSAPFVGVWVGQEARQELPLTNTGGMPLGVSTVELIGGGGAFAVERSTCANAQLQPNASCSVVVVFRPTAGGPASATLAAVWSGEGVSNVLRTAFSGMAVLPAPPPDPLAERIAAARVARREAGGGVQSAVVDPPATPERRFRNQDEDYKKIGIGRSYTTFPVDRTRILTTDRYIPCVLETGINSAIPGGVICVVEQPVYGSTGRTELIPAGTRWEGDYQPLAKNGDTRLNVIWRRMLTPQGASIYISSGFQAMDVAGRTGLPGDIDSRIWEKYGSAVLVTMLSAASAAASSSGSGRLQDFQSQAADGFARITGQILEENLDLRPVETVPGGSRLIIRPLTDLWFPNPEEEGPDGKPVVLQVSTEGTVTSTMATPPDKANSAPATPRPFVSSGPRGGGYPSRGSGYSGRRY